MASLPREHWQGCSGPWDPLIFSPLDGTPQEWSGASMPNYVVYRAAAGGVPDALQALMDAGLKLNHPVERLGSPLGIAILYQNLDLIRFLLAKGADPNNYYPFPCISLLHQAALLRSTVIIRLLLDHGATMRGSKALQGAAQVGSVEAAALALELGEDVDEVFRWDMCDQEDVDIIGTALHVAVRHNQEAMVEFLLRRGARQNLLDGAGGTVKTLAVEMGNLRIIRLLQQYEH
jgi:ankyrin repeat protein